MSEKFHQMLLAHLPKLRAYALMLTRNRPDADDLVQTATVLVLRAESQFIPGTNFSAWSYRILKNSYISTCRGHKRRPSSIDDVPEASLAYPARQYEQVLASEVVTAMGKLSVNLREVLTLICGGDMSYEDAAVAMSCSVGTVKSRLWRARDQMKIMLENVYSEAAESERAAQEKPVAVAQATGHFMHPLRSATAHPKASPKLAPILTEAATRARQINSDLLARHAMAEADDKRRVQACA